MIVTRMVSGSCLLVEVGVAGVPRARAERGTSGSASVFVGVVGAAQQGAGGGCAVIRGGVFQLRALADGRQFQGGVCVCHVFILRPSAGSVNNNLHRAALFLARALDGLEDGSSSSTVLKDAGGVGAEEGREVAGGGDLRPAGRAGAAIGILERGHAADVAGAKRPSLALPDAVAEHDEPVADVDELEPTGDEARSPVHPVEHAQQLVVAHDRSANGTSSI